MLLRLYILYTALQRCGGQIDTANTGGIVNSCLRLMCIFRKRKKSTVDDVSEQTVVRLRSALVSF